jgi:hypothetical protein
MPHPHVHGHIGGRSLFAHQNARNAQSAHKRRQAAAAKSPAAAPSQPRTRARPAIHELHSAVESLLSPSAAAAPATSPHPAAAAAAAAAARSPVRAPATAPARSPSSPSTVSRGGDGATTTAGGDSAAPAKEPARGAATALPRADVAEIGASTQVQGAPAKDDMTISDLPQAEV